MNRFLLSISVLSLIFCSCDKNKELSTYSEYYHIEDGNILSYIFVPNTFTPNADGSNDYFYPIANNFANEDFEWTVYNSNGEIIFQARGFNSGNWDGSYKGLFVEEGAYTYQVIATDITGYEYEITGNLNLMR